MFTIVFGCFIALLIAFVHFITVPSAVFTTDFAIVFEVFLFHQLSLPRLFFVRNFIFLLLYHEYYGFERDFFTLRCFLPYNLSRHLTQPAFIKVSLGPAVPSWRFQGFPLRFEIQTGPYVCLNYTVCSKRYCS